MSIKKKTVSYRVDGRACLQGFINVGSCDDKNVYDAEGEVVPDAVVTPPGDCPQEVVVVESACPSTGGPVGPTADVTLTGQDCNGSPVEVTGPGGTLVGIVNAPGTVIVTRACAPGESAVPLTPHITSSAANSLTALPAGQFVAMEKPAGAVVKVTTSAGAYTVGVGVVAHSTPLFKVPVQVITVEVVSGAYALDEILLTTQIS